MSQTQDRTRGRLERIARLERRLASIAEADAKERITDPMVSVVKGILDLLKDELR